MLSPELQKRIEILSGEECGISRPRRGVGTGLGGGGGGVAEKGALAPPIL